MNHIPQCPVCGNSALPEFFEPRGYALCPQCGFILRRLRDRLLPLYNIEPAEQIDLETSLPKGLGLDSLDMVELVMALKEEFGVEITDEEAAKIKTVEDIVRFLARHEHRGDGKKSG